MNLIARLSFTLRSKKRSVSAHESSPSDETHSKLFTCEALKTYLHKGFVDLSAHPLFGVANYLGAAAVLVFFLLVLISNDLSLRKLGTARWKSIQRWGYVAAGLTVIHGFAYQLVEKRQAGWVAVLLGIVGLAAGLQVTGFLLVRRARTLPTGIP